MEVPVILDTLRGDHWEWVKKRAHPILCQDTTGLVALKGDQIVGAIVFNSWSYNSCMVHIAIDDPWVTRRLIKAGSEFIFLHAKRELAMGLTPSDNEKALRMNRGVGFKEVYRIRDGYKTGVDYVLQEMRKEDCRWIKPALRKVA